MQRVDAPVLASNAAIPLCRTPSLGIAVQVSCPGAGVAGSPYTGSSVTLTTGNTGSAANIQLGSTSPSTVTCSAALTLSYNGALFSSAPVTVSFQVSAQSAGMLGGQHSTPRNCRRSSGAGEPLRMIALLGLLPKRNDVHSGRLLN